MAAGRALRLGSCVLASEIPLHELAQAELGARPELLVTRGEVVAPAVWDREFLDADGVVGHRVRRSGTDYVLQLAMGVDCVLQEEASQLRVSSSLPDELLGRLLVHQILPLVFAHRGALVLHGSAASVAGELIAFVGASGAGKSTLAAALASRPYGQLVADDTLWMGADSTAPSCRGSYAGVWLTDEACAALDVPPGGIVGAGKRLVLRDLAPPPAAPVTAIVRIAESDDEEREEIILEPLSAAELYFALFDNVFQLDPSDRPRATRVFERLTELAERVPGFQLKIPASFTRLPEVCERIRRVVAKAHEGEPGP